MLFRSRVYPDIPAAWRDDALAAKWERVRGLRRVVTGALELARANKKIGSSLQAHPVIHVAAEPPELGGFTADERSQIFITSGHEFTTAPAPADAFSLADVPGVAVSVKLASGDKCQRCWRVLPEVGRPRTGRLSAHSALCDRCAEAVAARPQAAQ